MTTETIHAGNMCGNVPASSVVDLPEDIDLFRVFDEGFDRFAFPGPVYRVTGGHGGEALLIAGSEKTALYDCGMAYCGDITVSNIIRRLSSLGREGLDYIFLSHSHYDHIGALPDIRRAFPRAKVCGSQHCADVLLRPGAHDTMKNLGEKARELYDPGSDKEITVDGLSVDMILSDGESVSLGRESLRVWETPGHTNCSVSYMLEPWNLLFTSESTGIIEGRNYIHTPCLKSFMQGLSSADKSRALGARYICLPHFGMIPEGYGERYWEMFAEEVGNKAGFVAGMKDRGMSEEEMFNAYAERYWTPAKAKEQPKEAFLLNSRFILKSLLRELDELRGRYGI